MSYALNVSGRNSPALQPPDRIPWMDDANCHYIDPEVFFQRTNAEDAPGKKYCKVCDVRQECLVFALLTENPDRTRYGVYGNAGPAERDRLYEALTGYIKNKNIEGEEDV